MDSMNSTYVGVAAIVSYLLATAMMIKALNADYGIGATSVYQRRRILGVAWLAAALHAFSIWHIFHGDGGINFSFLSAAALASLVIVLLLLLTAARKPVDKLGVVIFPAASLFLLLDIILPETMHVVRTSSWRMDVHILVSILSYSLLNMAAIQAILLALQDWQLRARNSNRFTRSLPPLQTMETLLFQLIAIGFVLLSISLLTGFMFLEDVFTQHLAHKTVLSILAWVVFAVLLWGRTYHGWRGQTAIRWTLGGFLSLMLAYFGSKMVLEIILKRV
jgi:ABC-type uncharacterized transport system permease subunit